MDCAGQWQSRDGLNALWGWLRRRWLPVAVLDISACNLEGDGAALLAEQVAKWPWLRRLSLAENGLTNQDAAGILSSTCEQRHHRLYVDLAYNAVNSTSQLGPRSDITLNIGPAWSRAEHALSGSNVNGRARSWRLYMSGPTPLLARTIDKSRLKPWRCPLWKCEVAAMSLRDGCRISIGRSLGSQDPRIRPWEVQIAQVLRSPRHKFGESIMNVPS